MAAEAELVVQAELRMPTPDGYRVTFAWSPVGLKVGMSVRRGAARWIVAEVYPLLVRDLAAEREWK